MEVIELENIKDLIQDEFNNINKKQQIYYELLKLNFEISNLENHVESGRR